MLYVNLVWKLASHLAQEIKELSPNDELLDGGRLSYLVERSAGLFLDPLIVVELFSHGHFPNGGSLEGEFGAQLILLRVVVEVIILG